MERNQLKDKDEEMERYCMEHGAEMEEEDKDGIDIEGGIFLKKGGGGKGKKRGKRKMTPAAMCRWTGCGKKYQSEEKYKLCRRHGNLNRQTGELNLKDVLEKLKKV